MHTKLCTKIKHEILPLIQLNTTDSVYLVLPWKQTKKNIMEKQRLLEFFLLEIMCKNIKNNIQLYRYKFRWYITIYLQIDFIKHLYSNYQDQIGFISRLQVVEKLVDVIKSANGQKE